MNKTVAIVGTHPNTRALAPFADRNIDIWVFNNQILQGWVPRANACFDIHLPEDIYRRGIEHPQFGDWLKADKGIVKYYTPLPMKDIPGNEIYPKDDVVAKLLPHLLRDGKINEYFTSGPCYAMALAIHLGYTRIELYGMEMESNAEYIYQRDGVGLWTGVAIGRGIDVILPKETLMFYAPLYGYDSDATKIDREAFETRGTELQQAQEQTLANYNAARGRLDAINSQVNEAKRNGAPDEELIKFSKEFIESTNAWEQAIADHAFVNGQYIDCRMWQARVDKALEYQGHSQELLAQNNDKWQRFADKETVSGKSPVLGLK